jgi:hypothetical protein
VFVIKGLTHGYFAYRYHFSTFEWVHRPENAKQFDTYAEAERELNTRYDPQEWDNGDPPFVFPEDAYTIEEVFIIK